MQDSSDFIADTNQQETPMLQQDDALRNIFVDVEDGANDDEYSDEEEA